MQRDDVAWGQVDGEEESVDAAPNLFQLFVSEEQARAIEAQPPASDRDEVAGDRLDAPPADPTAIQDLQGWPLHAGPEQSEPGVHGEDVEVVLGDARWCGRHQRFEVPPARRSNRSPSDAERATGETCVTSSLPDPVRLDHPAVERIGDVVTRGDELQVGPRSVEAGGQ